MLARVILTWTLEPFSVIEDMNFASGMNETYSLGWKIRDGISLVIYMCKVNVRIGVVCKGLVANLRDYFVKTCRGQIANRDGRTRGRAYPMVLNVVEDGK